jgi:hypothetical protein
MTKQEQVEQAIADYLYTRDDVLDLNEVDDIARELAKKLVVL